MVMTILVLFGMTIYSLIYSGKNTQEHIINEKDAQADARIALSYINVRLRQNDVNGKISVEKIDLTGKNAILIKECMDDYEYDTWIFCHNGMLMECLVDAGEQPTELDSFYIVDIEGVDTVVDPDGCITNTVYYYYGKVLENISSTVYMRSFSGYTREHLISLKRT